MSTVNNFLRNPKKEFYGSYELVTSSLNAHPLFIRNANSFDINIARKKSLTWWNLSEWFDSQVRTPPMFGSVDISVVQIHVCSTYTSQGTFDSHDSAVPLTASLPAVFYSAAKGCVKYSEINNNGYPHDGRADKMPIRILIRTTAIISA